MKQSITNNKTVNNQYALNKRKNGVDYENTKDLNKVKRVKKTKLNELDRSLSNLSLKSECILNLADMVEENNMFFQQALVYAQDANQQSKTLIDQNNSIIDLLRSLAEKDNQIKINNSVNRSTADIGLDGGSGDVFSADGDVLVGASGDDEDDDEDKKEHTDQTNVVGENAKSSKSSNSTLKRSLSNTVSDKIA